MQAIEKLSWYCLRWGIEVYHRTLKSGCKIEERQLGYAAKIESCLAIDKVIAWRIYHLTKLSREIPDVPCTVFFEEAEWKALVAYKTENPMQPKKTPTLRETKKKPHDLMELFFIKYYAGQTSSFNIDAMIFLTPLFSRE